ncbi:MAG: cysteine hydrolase [Firmicutes bacterium]|nr:cysteine hydrolase [Alicyclobacillaceae bacterium]MCL6497547.1 cysteine hydrolase [Bacillota bacterium]
MEEGLVERLGRAPRPWSLVRDRAALLVIDMENDFVQPGAVLEIPMAREALPNMVRLVAACRRLGVPVIFTRHVLYDAFAVSPLEAAYNPTLQKTGLREDSPGSAVIPELEPLPGEPVVTKHRYDAFYGTNLEILLNNIRGPRQVDTVLITGTVTSVCCESTARSAFMRDFKVVMVSDAMGGFDQASHEASLRILGMVFARVLTTDQVLAILERGEEPAG